jgi:hypothetical protein
MAPVFETRHRGWLKFPRSVADGRWGPQFLAPPEFLSPMSRTLQKGPFMRLPTFVMAAIVTTVAVGFATPSFAQYPQPYQYPGPTPNPQPPGSAAAPNGEYVAPLSQSTQQVYIPQSVALSGPRMIKDWEDGQPIPPGYHRETRVRKGLVITGAILFGVPYLYSAGGAALGSDAYGSRDNKLAALWVPCLGPFIEMGQTDSASARYILALDGLAQSAGMAMFIYGLAVPKNVLVRNDLALLTVMPMKLGKDGQGVGLIGRF